MTYHDNPEVISILSAQRLINSSEYMLRSEARDMTENDLFNGSTSIFKDSNIRHFNEFSAFTGIKTIKAEMFAGCSALSELTLPANIEFIEKNAFEYSAIRYIHIPQSIKNIHADAFIYTKSLQQIDVDIQAGIYRSIDGCVYKNNGTVLYIIPGGLKEYTMPDSVVSIDEISGSRIFLSGASLEKIHLNSQIQNFNGK
jgi:hypothetical protein